MLTLIINKSKQVKKTENPNFNLALYLTTTTQMSNDDRSITITRALVELKTIDKRIQKALDGAVFVTYRAGSEENPRQKITSTRYQQITDLIEYRKKLKAAVVRSNAATIVVIGKETYTVAGAIERKNSIQYDQMLLNTMRNQFGDVTRQVETHNEKVQTKLDGMLEKSFGSNQKSNFDELKSFSESYLRSNRAEVIDPLGLGEKTEKLDDRIVKFESEVDLVLSESNATTRIIVL